ncbi:MAG: hypothetical protein AABX05_02600 [Nanoarchaeota archaeon]
MKKDKKVVSNNRLVFILLVIIILINAVTLIFFLQMENVRNDGEKSQSSTEVPQKKAQGVVSLQIIPSHSGEQK